MPRETPLLKPDPVEVWPVTEEPELKLLPELLLPRFPPVLEPELVLVLAGPV